MTRLSPNLVALLIALVASIAVASDQVTADEFGATAGGTVAVGASTITVTGASAGDPRSLGVPSEATKDSTYSCAVTGTDTVTVYRNCAAGETAGVANACANDGSLTWKASVVP